MFDYPTKYYRNKEFVLPYPMMDQKYYGSEFYLRYAALSVERENYEQWVQNTEEYMKTKQNIVNTIVSRRQIIEKVPILPLGMKYLYEAKFTW